MTPTPTLRFAFRITAFVAPGIPIERQGGDTLDFIPLTGGPVVGEVDGEVVAGGGDWCLHRADGSYDVEARYLIRTRAGETVDVVNVGVIPEPVDGVEPSHFVTTPRFRTVAPSLRWLTRSVFVGRSTATDEATTIDVYEVMP